ncbi:MAG: hypothetical protein F6K31_09000 [Symploca sp. SIO2G7]|nr:hypothetical protein [Symploca sp. SIO2G7]
MNQSRTLQRQPEPKIQLRGLWISEDPFVFYRQGQIFVASLELQRGNVEMERYGKVQVHRRTDKKDIYIY